MTDEGTLSLALSGGGHRATAFGLGAMLAVADAGLNGRIVSISSVSGGSIANGIAMVGPDYRTSSSQEIAAHFRGALRGISARGVLLGGAPATRAYIRTLIGTGVITALALVALLVTAILNWWTAVLIAAVVMLAAAVAFWVLFRRRSVRTERAIDAELLGGKEITLAAIGARDLGVHHVICTTELQAGHSFFFTSRGVYGYGFGGSTSPPGIPLATAVQASAAVPGAFAPGPSRSGRSGSPAGGASLSTTAVSTTTWPTSGSTVTATGSATSTVSARSRADGHDCWSWSMGRAAGTRWRRSRQAASAKSSPGC